MTVSVKDISELRKKTGAGMMDCKEALTNSGGDVDQAIIYLRKKGITDGKNRASKAALEGTIGYYIHAGGRIGVMVDICCETDFVANSAPFQEFSKDVSMHIAAANPRWLDRSSVPQDIIDSEKDIMASHLDGKPEDIIEKIIKGKIDKFFKENCLMEQLFVKDNNLSISDLIADLTVKIGEKVEIRKFVRYSVGE